MLSTNHSSTIEVSEFNSGHYFVALRIGDREVVKKIVNEYYLYHYIKKIDFISFN